MEDVFTKIHECQLLSHGAVVNRTVPRLPVWVCRIAFEVLLNRGP